MSEWYYGRDGQQTGPVSSPKLRELAENGDLRPEDLVWKEGLPDWIRASQVKGLFPKQERIATQTGISNFSANKKTVVVSCTNCTARYKVDEAAVIKNRVTCKACGNRIIVRLEKEQTIRFPLPEGIVTTRELTNDEIAIVRRRLTAFARDIPHHDIENFGEAVTIVESRLVPCYRITVKTLNEQRAVECRESPYMGQAIPPLAVTEENIAPWSYEFVNRTELEPFEDERRVDDSQDVHACGDCSKSGRITCPDCSGHGQVCCPECAGSTAVACSQCRGRGAVQQERSMPVPKACWVCNGTGRPSDHVQSVGLANRCGHCQGRGEYIDYVSEYYDTPCTSCGAAGRVKCHSCGATGAVTCRTCNGETYITCPRCEGRTQLVSYLTITQTLTPSFLSKIEFDGEIEDQTRSLLASKIEDEPDIPVVEVADAVELSSSLEEFSQSAAVPTLVAAIRELLMDASGKVDDDSRIAYQSIEVRQSVALTMRYSFDDRQYDACGFGREASLLPLRTPFSDLAQSALKAAFDFWKQGQKQKAIESFNLCRAIAAKEEVSQRILDEHQDQVPFGLKTAAAANSMMISARAGMLRGATKVSETIDAVKNSKLGQWFGRLKDGGEMQE